MFEKSRRCVDCKQLTQDVRLYGATSGPLAASLMTKFDLESMHQLELLVLHDFDRRNKTEQGPLPSPVSVVMAPSSHPILPEQVKAIVRRSPDASPPSIEDLSTPNGTAHRKLREALTLTRKEFAARYHIPLATLHDWEHETLETRSIDLCLSDHYRAPPHDRAARPCKGGSEPTDRGIALL